MDNSKAWCLCLRHNRLQPPGLDNVRLDQRKVLSFYLTFLMWLSWLKCWSSRLWLLSLYITWKYFLFESFLMSFLEMACQKRVVLLKTFQMSIEFYLFDRLFVKDKLSSFFENFKNERAYIHRGAFKSQKGQSALSFHKKKRILFNHQPLQQSKQNYQKN